MQLIRASFDDAELILNMQIESFTEFLNKYQDYETNPAKESIEKIRWKLNQPSTYFYFMKYNDNIVGAIRVVDSKKDGEYKRISPVFVLPQYRNNGFSQQAITEVEKIHGKSNWNLSTIEQEKGNCYLYEKMGYQRFGDSKVINDKMTLVFYEKH